LIWRTRENLSPALFEMKSLIATFTAVNVLAHSVFGCCSHHAGTHAGGAAVERDCESQAGELRSSISKHHHDGECHSHFVASLPVMGKQLNAPCFCEGQSGGHGSHQCPHATCQWLARDVAVASVVVDLITHVAANTLAPAVLVPVSPELLSREVAVAPNSVVPLRLHLALGVLLI
jgi:hypothetical protein